MTDKQALQARVDWLVWKHGFAPYELCPAGTTQAMIDLARKRAAKRVGEIIKRRPGGGDLLDAFGSGTTGAGDSVTSTATRRSEMSAVILSVEEAREMFEALGEGDAASWKPTKLQKRLERLTADSNGHLTGPAEGTFKKVMEAHDTGREVRVEGADAAEAAPGEANGEVGVEPTKRIAHAGTKPPKKKAGKGKKPAAKEPAKVKPAAKVKAKTPRKPAGELDSFGARVPSERHSINQALTKSAQTAGEIAKAAKAKYQSNVKRYLDDLVEAKKIKQTKDGGYCLK